MDHVRQLMIGSVLAHFGAVDIKQYRECTAMSDGFVCMFTFLFHLIAF